MPEKLRIAIGSDEAGYQYKEAIKADLLKSNLVESVQDVGIEQDENTAYPHIAIAAARRIIAAFIGGNDVRQAVAVHITSGNALGTAAHSVIHRGLERAVSIA